MTMYAGTPSARAVFSRQAFSRSSRVRRAWSSGGTSVTWGDVCLLPTQAGRSTSTAKRGPPGPTKNPAVVRAIGSRRRISSSASAEKVSLTGS